MQYITAFMLVCADADGLVEKSKVETMHRELLWLFLYYEQGHWRLIMSYKLVPLYRCLYHKVAYGTGLLE